MPLYAYTCKDCNESFELRHSMSEEGQKCILCGSVNIFKNLSFTIGKTPHNLNTRPGAIVDSFIEDTKKQLKIEKKRLKEEEW